MEHGAQREDVGAHVEAIAAGHLGGDEAREPTGAEVEHPGLPVEAQEERAVGQAAVLDGRQPVERVLEGVQLVHRARGVDDHPHHQAERRQPAHRLVDLDHLAQRGAGEELVDRPVAAIELHRVEQREHAGHARRGRLGHHAFGDGAHHHGTLEAHDAELEREPGTGPRPRRECGEDLVAHGHRR